MYMLTVAGKTGGGTNYCDGVISGKRMSIILYISTHVFPSCHQQACLSLYVKSLSMHRQSKRKKKERGVVYLTGTSADWLLLPIWRSTTTEVKTPGTIPITFSLLCTHKYNPSALSSVLLACCSLQVTWLSPPLPPSLSSTKAVKTE